MTINPTERTRVNMHDVDSMRCRIWDLLDEAVEHLETAEMDAIAREHAHRSVEVLTNAYVVLADRVN